MKTLASQTGDTRVLTITGRLDSDAAPEFEMQCSELLAEGGAKVMVLDLTKLDYLSSAGLRAILTTGKTMEGKNGKLVLCVPPGQTRMIIEASGFHKIFSTCSTLEETGKFTTGNFRIHAHKEYDVDVLTIYGRVDAEKAPELEAAGRKVLETPYTKLVLNFSSVQYLSSAGLCALLNLGKLADARKGRLFLCSPSASVRQILKMSGFDKILTLRDSVQDALVE